MLQSSLEGSLSPFFLLEEKMKKQKTKQPLSIEAFSALISARLEFYNKEEVQDILYAARDMMLDLMMEGEPVNIPKFGTFQPCTIGRTAEFLTKDYGVKKITPRFGWKVVRHAALRREFHEETVKVRKQMRMPTEPVTKKGARDAD